MASKYLSLDLITSRTEKEDWGSLLEGTGFLESSWASSPVTIAQDLCTPWREPHCLRYSSKTVEASRWLEGNYRRLSSVYVDVPFNQNSQFGETKRLDNSLYQQNSRERELKFTFGWHVFFQAQFIVPITYSEDALTKVAVSEWVIIATWNRVLIRADNTAEKCLNIFSIWSRTAFRIPSWKNPEIKCCIFTG